jgi:hypothetical protein
MMTDDLLQLTTASVDGELTLAENRRLLRLLDSSPEARALCTKFHGDSKLSTRCRESFPRPISRTA